jgi:hypothetical protein
MGILQQFHVVSKSPHLGRVGLGWAWSHRGMGPSDVRPYREAYRTESIPTQMRHFDFDFEPQENINTKSTQRNLKLVALDIRQRLSTSGSQ